MFVANPTAAGISVYPADGSSFGNVPTLVTNPDLVSPSGIARDSAGNLYVANTGNNAINEYASGANGAPNPIATIAGANTGLNNPVAVALDSNANIYVANCGTCTGATGADSITVYPAGSNGNVAPTAVITGTNTGLAQPSGLVLDANNNIYVANGANAGSVTVYAAGSNGDVAPVSTISGVATSLLNPTAIALDSAGNIYVASGDYNSNDGGTVEVFPPGSSGDTVPTAVIYGFCSSLDDPTGLAVDSSGNIYAANNGYLGTDPVSITVYAAGSSECAAPTTTITGAATGLAEPAGLALDSSANIYVSDLYNNTISVFSAGSNGNVAPAATIADPDTGMDFPLGVALDSNWNLYVVNAGSVDGGFDSVTIYPAGSDANVTPTATISASGAATDNTRLLEPDAIVVGPAGHIYVANPFAGNEGNGTVTVYMPGDNGNVAPQATLGGPDTGLNYPVGLAMNSTRNLHVLNAFGGPDYFGSVTVYNTSTGSIDGDVAPVWSIHGTSSSDQTGFDWPSGIALDSSGNIYVTNDGSVSGEADSVTIYAAGIGGNVAPAAIISGTLTQLTLPSAIAVDSLGNIWVANDGSLGGGVDTITVYPPGSNGNVAPSMLLSNGTVETGAVISGLLTGLSEPAGIAINPVP